MFTVVLDTNVVVSAALCAEGNPAKIFEMLILEEIQNITTQEIIDEIKETFEKPKITKKTSHAQRIWIIETFEQLSEKITPMIEVNALPEDPDDNKFLACALQVSATHIISGDEHLLRLKEFRGIKITSPAEFVERMKEYLP